MQSLKSASLLQKLKSIFLNKRSTNMQNIFGNIQLMPVQIEQSQNFIEKQHTQFNIKNQEYNSAKKMSSIPSKNCKNVILNKKLSFQKQKQIQQLKQSILKTKQKNMQVKNKISELSSDFAYVLFIPKHYLNKNNQFNQQIKMFERKLLSQLDKLYEQNCFLQKQWNRINFSQQNENKQKEEKLNSIKNHYQFLRNVWMKNDSSKFLSNNQNQLKSQEMLEKLNNKIAIIRTNINIAIKQELNHEKKSISYNKIEDQFVQSSVKYKKLLHLYESTSMQFQDHRSIVLKHKQFQKQSQNNEINEEKIKNLQKKVKQLQKKIVQKDIIILKLKDQSLFNEIQLNKFKKQERNLKSIFYCKGNTQKNQKYKSEIRFYDFDIYSFKKVQVEKYQSQFKITQIIDYLSKNSEKLNYFQYSNQQDIIKPNQQKIIEVKIPKLSCIIDDEFTVSRKTLNPKDLNRIIKTDRLIKDTLKTNQQVFKDLDSSFNKFQSVGKSILNFPQKQDYIQYQKQSHRILQGKQNQNQLLIEYSQEKKLTFKQFPVTSSLNFEDQGDSKLKFVRKSIKNRKQIYR